MALSVRVCGAARTVTGYCLVFDTGQSRFLVDCGMFQGPKTLKSLNWEEFPFNPREIDAVLLTHAHIDHSGLLPKLKAAGFRGVIHATAETAKLIKTGSLTRKVTLKGILASKGASDAVTAAGGSLS